MKCSTCCIILAQIIFATSYVSAEESVEAAESRVRQLREELSLAEERLEELRGKGGTNDVKTTSEGARTPPEPQPALDGVAEDGGVNESPLDYISQTLHDLKLSVRYSAFDQSAIQDPAQIQFTRPGEGSDSYSIDVGATWNLTELTGNTIDFGRGTEGLADISILAEYHRNTQTDSKKDSFLAGGLLTAHIGDVARDPWIHYFDAKATYKRDRVNTGRGLLADLTYWPLIPRPADKGYGFPNIGGSWGPEWLVIQTQPGFAIQFENADDVDMSGRSGDTWRGKFIFELAIYPFANLLERDPSSEIGPLELTGSYQYWSNWGSSGGFDLRDDHHDLWKGSINYYFGQFDEDLEQRNFAIGLDYVEGENPEEGFADDNYWQLGLKFIF